MSILKYHPHRRLRHNSPNSLFFSPPAVSPDTAVFLSSKKELLQCLTKTKSVFCMFSRANIRKNGLLQMSCAPFSSLSLGSGLYFFRPQSPRKNAHSLLRYFGIRGICITSLPAARFANLLFENRKTPNISWTVRFRGDFGRFYLIWLYGGGKARYLLLCGNRKAPHRCGTFALPGRWNGGCSVICCSFYCWQQRLFQWLHYRWPA